MWQYIKEGMAKQQAGEQIADQSWEFQSLSQAPAEETAQKKDAKGSNR